MCKHSQGLAIVFDPINLSHFNQLMNTNEVTKFRILDLFAAISSLSVEAFQLSESSCMLTKVIHCLDTDDILGKLNAIELLEKVGYLFDILYSIFDILLNILMLLSNPWYIHVYRLLGSCYS